VFVDPSKLRRSNSRIDVPKVTPQPTSTIMFLSNKALVFVK